MQVRYSSSLKKVSWRRYPRRVTRCGRPGTSTLVILAIAEAYAKNAMGVNEN